MHDEHQYAYRYNQINTPPKQVEAIRQHCVERVMRDYLMKRLLEKPEKILAVRLRESDSPVFGFSGREEWREIHISLEVNEVSTFYITEYIDLRPVGWWALSQTAAEEIMHRLTEWWQLPLAQKRAKWGRRLARFERKHFGRAFNDGRQKPGITFSI